MSSSNSSSYHGDRRITSCNGIDIVKCKCGIEASVWAAWKSGTKNPGRRFYGCMRFRESRGCNFFLWRDPEYTDRGREVIIELMSELSMKREEIKMLKKVETMEGMQTGEAFMRKLEKQENEL